MRKVKIVISLLLLLILLAVTAIWQRHNLIVNLYKSSPDLLAKSNEGEAIIWFDDYYTVQKLGNNVYAIGEPRYWQRNYNYLIIGSKRALLIDAGPGIRDIKPVVKSLTDLPYTLAFTHFHFDHVGNGQAFPHMAVIDLPHLRDRSIHNTIQLKKVEHLGKPEGFKAPNINVDEWITPNVSINLGNREVNVIYTPGHTIDSISFYDSQSNILFSGDWFSQILGPMFSNSNMGDFEMAIDNVLCAVPKNARLFSAHKYEDGGGAPILTMQDVISAKEGFGLIKDKKIKAKGFYPAVYKLTPEISLYTDITWLQNWSQNYPNLNIEDCGNR